MATHMFDEAKFASFFAVDASRLRAFNTWWKAKMLRTNASEKSQISARLNESIEQIILQAAAERLEAEKEERIFEAQKQQQKLDSTNSKLCARCIEKSIQLERDTIETIRSLTGDMYRHVIDWKASQANFENFTALLEAITDAVARSFSLQFLNHNNNNNNGNNLSAISGQEQKLQQVKTEPNDQEDNQIIEIIANETDEIESIFISFLTADDKDRKSSLRSFTSWLRDEILRTNSIYKSQIISLFREWINRTTLTPVVERLSIGVGQIFGGENFPHQANKWKCSTCVKILDLQSRKNANLVSSIRREIDSMHRRVIEWNVGDSRAIFRHFTDRLRDIIERTCREIIRQFDQQHKTLQMEIDLASDSDSTIIDENEFSPNQNNETIAKSKSSKRIRKSISNLYDHRCSHRGCGKSFASASLLRTHLRVHETAKPYRCLVDGCLYRSNTITNAVKHVRLVHFELPVTRKRQKKLGIVDDRDPNRLIARDDD